MYWLEYSLYTISFGIEMENPQLTTIMLPEMKIGGVYIPPICVHEYKSLFINCVCHDSIEIVETTCSPVVICCF
ncbi:MAG: hypothetical protein WCH65_08615 [bacterium]